MADKKIFCKECVYITSSDREFMCDAPDNFMEVITYYAKRKERLEHPRDINKNNDCKWFKDKGF